MLLSKKYEPEISRLCVINTRLSVLHGRLRYGKYKKIENSYDSIKVKIYTRTHAKSAKGGHSCTRDFQKALD